MASAELLIDRTHDVSDPEAGSGGSLLRERDRRWIACCAVSTTVHLMLIGALALVWWSLPTPPVGTAAGIQAVDSIIDEPELRQFAELPDVLNASETETTIVPSGGAAAAVLQARSPAESLSPASPGSGLTASAAWQNWMGSDLSAPAELAAGRSGTGDGTGSGIGSDGGNDFFGLPPSGRRFVYVLDCSRSMNHPHNTEAKTRFKRMKIELVRSVAGLAPEMEFFMVFFNDLPIVMPARGFVPAVPSVQQQYLQWMSELKARGQTEPLTALQIAVAMQPDVIYFLTDGSFSYGVEQQILGLPSGRTKIHTFAFHEPMTPEMRRAYELLGDDNGGRARQLVEKKKDFQRVVAVWKAHKFLRNVATKHGGTFRIIPENG